METVVPITYFRGHHRWLSNFHPCKIRIRGHEFDSVEHAYQALKFDESKWPNFKGITAKEAKRLGYKIFPGLPEEWYQRKVVLMEALLEQKFAPGSELALALLATGEAELVEGNNWGDTFWGVCDGVGENHLGKLLMKRRKVLMQQSQTLYDKPNNAGLSSKQDNCDETVPTAVRQEQETDAADHGGLQAQVRELP